MSSEKDIISKRKKEHLELCLTDEVAFKNKTNGFEMYDFIHCATTEVDFNSINFKTTFLNKVIDFPFLISCMTGGTEEAERINQRLAIVASELNIPIGVGSQRRALEDNGQDNSYKAIRKCAGNVPVLGNIGAAQIVKLKNIELIKRLVDLIEADALVIHLNPLQELLQKEGESNFIGLVNSIRVLVQKIKVPIFIKEVGAGISLESAKKMLEIGVVGIDVAGAGGTSWAGVELLRSNNKKDNLFWDWGLPTSYCIRNIKTLKEKYNFSLIGSGGINSSLDNAKAIALGADFTASARILLQTLNNSSTNGVINLLKKWFDDLKKIMFLTGSNNLEEFKQNKLQRKGNLY